MGKCIIVNEMKENYRIVPDMDYIVSVKDTEPILFASIYKNALRALIAMRNYIRALPSQSKRKYVKEYIVINSVLRDVCTAS